MSLSALLSRDTVTIQRVSVTAQNTGGQTRSYSTSNRPSGAPTTWNCRIQQMSADEAVRYGLKGTNSYWKFLGHTRPQVDERDRFTFTDSEGTSHTVYMLGSERNGDNQGIMWQVNGDEKSNES